MKPAVRGYRALIVLLCLLCGPALAAAEATIAERVVTAARTQIGVTLTYDGSYRTLVYPGGDVPITTGVCTDVVIRALRAADIDLQRAVYEDRGLHPQRYRQSPRDRNIDHRRVPNLQSWFARHAESLTPSREPANFIAGDIVTWKLPGNLDHIGIVSDQVRDGRPLIIHNIGRGAQEEDVLLAWTINGHYRLAQ